MTTILELPDVIRVQKDNTAIILKDAGNGHMQLIQAVKNGEENLQHVTQCSLMQAGVFVQHFLSDLIFRIQEQNENQIGVWMTWVDEEKIPEVIRREWMDTQDEYFKALNNKIIAELEDK